MSMNGLIIKICQNWLLIFAAGARFFAGVPGSSSSLCSNQQSIKKQQFRLTEPIIKVHIPLNIFSRDIRQDNPHSVLRRSLL